MIDHRPKEETHSPNQIPRHRPTTRCYFWGLRPPQLPPDPLRSTPFSCLFRFGLVLTAYSNVSVGALRPSGSASPHNVRYAKSPGSSEHSNAGAFYVTRFLMRRYLYARKQRRGGDNSDAYNHPARLLTASLCRFCCLTKSGRSATR